jgi:hypothetical protein
MEVTINKPKQLKSSEIPDGVIFWASKVGNGPQGIYVKLPGHRGGAIWPIRNSRVAKDGDQYSSPECPVIGYEPINFVVND